MYEITDSVSEISVVHGNVMVNKVIYQGPAMIKLAVVPVSVATCGAFFVVFVVSLSL